MKPDHIGQTEGEFSVYWYQAFFGEKEEIDKRWVGPAEAMEAVQRLTKGPAAIMGAVKRVIVTDGLDNTALHWEDGKLVFPTREDVEASKSNSSKT